MSMHCYCTTTVGYYMMLEDDCFNAVYCPQHVVSSNSYGTGFVGSLVYFTDLYNSMPMGAGLSNHHGNDLIFVQCSQPQRTLYEYGDQHEYQQAYELEQQRLQQQREQQQDQQLHDEPLIDVPPSLYTEENVNQPTDGDAIVTDPQTENKPISKRNIYLAKQGYLVEEPSSDESDDEASETTSHNS